MTYISPIGDRNEHAVRFLVAVGSATKRQVVLGTARAASGGLAETFGLSGIMGYQGVPDDLVLLGLASWVDGRLQPTEEGRKALAYCERTRREALATESGEPHSLIVGIPSEPIVYAAILEEIAGMDRVMFVDRYLGASDAKVLVQIKSTERILTGPRPVVDRLEASPEWREQQLSFAAGVRPEVEIRLSQAMHDRYALPATGRGLMLGSSLGGRKLTVALSLSEQATAELRAAHEKFWAEGQPITPLGAP